jgi:vacuolar-type H+-ATPase subunit C/Vma6
MSESKHKEPLALSVVMAACGGDEDALRAVVKHYEGYITALSMKRLFDEDGEQYLFVDEELRRELETRLITKVLTFKPLSPKAA